MNRKDLPCCIGNEFTSRRRMMTDRLGGAAERAILGDELCVVDVGVGLASAGYVPDAPA